MKTNTALLSTQSREDTKSQWGDDLGLQREAKRHAAFVRATTAAAPKSPARSKAVSPPCSDTAVQIFASLLLCVFVLIPSIAGAATNDLGGLLQRGLFEEEANRNLDAAAQAYQTVSAQFDKDRKLAATAIFRLGEIYRKQGKTNEAVGQYKRIAREFADQDTLVTLSRQNLAGLGTTAPANPARTEELHRQQLEQQVIVDELESLVAQVKKLDQHELRRVLPKVSPDPLLAGLMDEVSLAQKNYAILLQNPGASSPQTKAQATKLDQLDKLVDERVDGVVAGLERRLANTRSQLESLNAQAAPVRSVGAVAALSRTSRLEQKRLLEEEIKLTEQDLADIKKQVATGQAPQSAPREKEREILKLRRQLAALDVTAGETSTGQDASTTDEEEAEIRRIQAMIQNSPDLVNAASGREGTPLFQAVIKGQLRVATFLLDHGATVNTPSGGRGKIEERWTPLITAANGGHKAMAELLLTNGADVNQQDNQGNSALHYATKNGFVSVMETLIARSANLNTKGEDQKTPLHFAAGSQRPATAELLLAKGADVNARDKLGRTPLMDAVINSSLPLVKAILAAYAEPNLKDNDGRTALSLAAGHSTLAEIVRALTAAKADPNIHGNDGRTALDYAAARGSVEFIKPLVEAGADVNGLDAQGRTVLSRGGWDTNVAKLLIEAKADPNLGTAESTLLQAVRSDNGVLAEMLLRAGADANQSTRCNKMSAPSKPGRGRIRFQEQVNRTPLQAAVSEEHPAMVNLLLRYKGDAKANGPEGFPLVLSAIENPEVLKALLEAGADANANDGQGRNALIIAASAGNFVAVDLLLAHGAKTEVRGEHEKVPLLWAIENGCTNCVASLLSAGADVNAKNESDWSALHYAVGNGRLAILQMLLAKGADPNVRNNDGQTPLDLTKPQSGAGVVATFRPGEEPRANPKELGDLLRQHGALDDLPALDRIQVKRPAVNFSKTIFGKGTNDGQQFTLFELLAVQYQFLAAVPGGEGGSRVDTLLLAMNDHRSDALPFPDLAHVRLRRPVTDGKSWEEEVLDVVALLRSGDCSKDMPLHWGDEVVIPETDHPLGAPWGGFSRAELKTLDQCLTRKVEIIVKGQSTKITVGPKFEYLNLGNSPYVVTKAPVWIQPVLRGSNLVLSSSDLSRVKVTRRDAATGQAREWILDCSRVDSAPAFWLRDGDVIEVPDKP